MNAWPQQLFRTTFGPELGRCGAAPGLGSLWSRLLGPVSPLPRYLFPSGGQASDQCLDPFSATARPATSTDASEVQRLVGSLPLTRAILGGISTHLRGGLSDHYLDQFSATARPATSRSSFSKPEVKRKKPALWASKRTNVCEIGDWRKQIGSPATCRPRTQLRLPSPELPWVPLDVGSSKFGPFSGLGPGRP